MKADSPSAPKLIPACSGLDDSERSNGFGTKYQLVGKLASAAIARFMPRQRRTTDKKHSMVPATEPKRRRQRSHPLEKGKIKKFRMLGTCFRCHAYTETVSSMDRSHFHIDWLFSMVISPIPWATSCARVVNGRKNPSDPVIMDH